MKDKEKKIRDLIACKKKLNEYKDVVTKTKGDKTMSGWIIALIVILAVIVGLFLLTFLVYIFNLDMKMMAGMEKILLKHYDKVERDEHL